MQNKSLIKFGLLNSETSFTFRCDSVDGKIKPEVSVLRYKRGLGLTYELTLVITHIKINDNNSDERIDSGSDPLNVNVDGNIKLRDEDSHTLVNQSEDPEILNQGEDTQISNSLGVEANIDEIIQMDNISENSRIQNVSNDSEKIEEKMEIQIKKRIGKKRCCGCLTWLRNIFKVKD